MKIYLNDKEIEFMGYAEPTVESLVRQEEINPQGTAIAVNDRIVRKTSWASTLLNPGDKVTVVKIAFGG